MEASEREALKERHRYSEWAGRSTAPSDRSVRKFMFTGDELPGYRLDRVDRREAPQPARVTAFWRRAGTTKFNKIAASFRSLSGNRYCKFRCIRTGIVPALWPTS